LVRGHRESVVCELSVPSDRIVLPVSLRPKRKAYGLSVSSFVFFKARKGGKVTKEDCKVQGVVVTGDAERLKSLHGLPFIKASSLGVVTEKY